MSHPVHTREHELRQLTGFLKGLCKPSFAPLIRPLPISRVSTSRGRVVFQMSPFRVVTPKGDIWKTTRAQWGVSTGTATGIPAQVREELWDDNALSSGSSSGICAGAKFFLFFVFLKEIRTDSEDWYFHGCCNRVSCAGP